MVKIVGEEERTEEEPASLPSLLVHGLRSLHHLFLFLPSDCWHLRLYISARTCLVMHRPRQRPNSIYWRMHARSQLVVIMAIVEKWTPLRWAPSVGGRRPHYGVEAFFFTVGPPFSSFPSLEEKGGLNNYHQQFISAKLWARKMPPHSSSAAMTQDEHRKRKVARPVVLPPLSASFPEINLPAFALQIAIVAHSLSRFSAPFP